MIEQGEDFDNKCSFEIDQAKILNYKTTRRVLVRELREIVFEC